MLQLYWRMAGRQLISGLFFVNNQKPLWEVKNVFRYSQYKAPGVPAMGNSAQDHRLKIGPFAGRMCSSSWSPCTGSFRVKRRKREPNIACWSTSWYSVPIVVMMTLVTFAMWPLLVPETVATSSYKFSPNLRRTVSAVETGVCERTAGQMRQLLIMSGDVESNPWPPAS